jgi:hypothetical protein
MDKAERDGRVSTDEDKWFDSKDMAADVDGFAFDDSASSDTQAEKLFTSDTPLFST